MTAVPSKRPEDISGTRHRRIIRVSAYSVASVLAVLMLTAAMPPIFADQSDRAILNTNVSLITSPIAGEISELKVAAGERMDEGSVAAEVGNTRVDRTTLMTLESKAADARQALDAARSKRASDQRYLQALDSQIASQKDQLLKQFASQATELQGQLEAAQAFVAEKDALRDRQVNLVSRNVSDPYMLKPTTQQLSGAQGMRGAAAAKLAANTAQMAAVKQDVFVGDNLVGIGTLAQKRRDIAFDAERQLIEQNQAAATLADNVKLLDAERERIERMSKAVLTAPSNGRVLHVGAAVGRHVNAGDTLVSLVDCNNLFAVGIFSYRQATTLSVGTRVTITSDGMKPIGGSVREILPRSSDATDALYALPFPQTERREMYVLVKPDEAASASSENGRADGSCPFGQWVTITRQDAWMPSTSVIWHKAAGAVTAMLRGAFAPSAHARTRPAS